MLKIGRLYRLRFPGIAARVIEPPPGGGSPQFPHLVETLFLRSRYYVNERGEPAYADAPRLIVSADPISKWRVTCAAGMAFAALWFSWALWLHGSYVESARPPGTVSKLNFIYNLAGLAYISPAPSVDGLADKEPDGQISPLLLYENDRPLGPAHSAQLDTMNIGLGRFSHWKGHGFVFSASDNSDPRTNGRNYWIVDPEKLAQCKSASVPPC